MRGSLNLEPPSLLNQKQMRARDVFAYFSPKLGRTVMCVGESNYRLGAWLEGRPEFIGYSERPFEKVQSRAHADFIALKAFRDKPVLRVIWATQRFQAENNNEASSRFAQSKNAHFERFDDRNSAALRCEVDNYLQMLPWVSENHRRPSMQCEQHILETLAKGPCTLAELQRTGEYDAGVLRAAFSFHFAGRVSIDMAAELSLDSLVRQA